MARCISKNPPTCNLFSLFFVILSDLYFSFSITFSRLDWHGNCTWRWKLQVGFLGLKKLIKNMINLKPQTLYHEKTFFSRGIIFLAAADCKWLLQDGPVLLLSQGKVKTQLQQLSVPFNFSAFNEIANTTSTSASYWYLIQLFYKSDPSNVDDWW